MKKRLVCMLLALAMLFSTSAIGASALQLQEQERVTPGSWADGFADPDSSYDPGFRYWLPLGYTEDEELERELEAMSAKGLSVVELTTQANPTGIIPEGKKYAGLNYASDKAYGMGSDEWTRTIYTTLKKANELGIRVDYHVSQNNGSNKHLPGLSPNDEAASKELVYEAASVTGSKLPELAAVTPAAKTYKDNVTGEAGLPLDQHLFAVLLVNITEKGRQENRLVEGDVWAGAAGVSYFDATVDVIDSSKTVDVTALYQADAAEADKAAAEAAVDAADLANGTWEVLGFWWRGDCVTVSGSTEFPSYRIDYFGKAGANALMDYYEEHVFQLNNPEFAGMADLLKENGGYLFADSYGANANWGNDLPEAFEALTGESIINYLPAIFQPVNAKSSFGYVLDTVENTNDIVADYHQAMTDLYCENDLDVLVERCAKIGIGYRDQIVYATSRLDLIQAAAHVDVAEGESLNQADSTQYFTAISSASHLLGKEIVSSEHGATMGTYSGSYNYSLKTALQQANRAFAGGVNQLLLHGYTYNYMDFDGENAKWPGRTAYTNSFSENWKDNLPQWSQIDVFSNYASRVGYVMRTGTVKRDVAIYKQSYWWPRHVGILWRDYGLNDAGYTFDFLSSNMLDYPEATVTDGVLAAETAGYRAFIFDGTGEKDLQDVADDLITLEAIEKFVEYAGAGLPIVFVGTYPTGLQGLATAEKQDRFEAALNTLKGMDNVVLVEDRSDVPAALEALDVEPAAKNLDPDRVISYHTQSDDADFYFLYNQSRNYINSANWNEVSVYVTHFGGQFEEGHEIRTQLALEGEGVPFLMDPYSGEVTPIAEYSIDADGRIVVDLDLAIDGATIIAVGKLGNGEAAIHGSIDSDTAALVYDNDALKVEATAAGSYQAALNNGSVATVDVDTIPEVSLSSWNLSIDSYTNKNDINAVGKAATEMKHTIVSGIELTDLQGWMDLGTKSVTLTAEDGTVTTADVDLKTLSGIGTYTATLTTPAGWSDNDGVYLNIGDAYSTYKVLVNGRQLPNVDALGGKVNLRGYLKAGENTVSIVTPSGMVNAMRTVRPGYIDRKEYTSYGLRENATVTPYVLAKVPSSEATVSLHGDADVTVDTKELTYTVSAAQAEQLATATVTLDISGVFSGEPTLEAQNGFYVISSSFENGKLTAVIGNNAGVSPTDALDILTVTVPTAGQVGTVRATLEEAVLSAYCGSGEMFLAVTYGDTTVETDVHYSIYDVNQDGVVNQLDITRAQRAYGKSAGDEGWNALVDVNQDGTVDINDLILILNNYTK